VSGSKTRHNQANGGAALEDVDAAAVMVLPPYFFKPVSARGLLDFCTVRPPLEPVAADAALHALVDEIEAAVA
jgi:hypothetical protein